MKADLMRYVIALLLLSLTASCSSDNTKTADNNSGPSIPAGAEFTGFSVSGTPKAFDRGGAWDNLGDKADKFLYNGFEKGMSTQYVSDDKARNLKIDVMKFSEPERAYGLYLYLRPAKSHPVDVQPLGCFGKDTLLFVKGSYLGRAVGSYSNSETDLILASRMALSKITDSVMLPVQVQYYPAEGMIPNSQTVLLDDIGGMSVQSNLFGASYLVDGDTVHVYVQANPGAGPTMAVSKFIGKEGRVKDYLMDSDTQALTGTDGQGRYVYCAVRNNVLCAIVGRIDLKAEQELADKCFALAAKSQ